MAIVDFIIAGFMKSGTTTLHDYLVQNTDISMCYPKEPQFFSRNYSKGIEFYESYWAEGKKICGEASTCYSRWPFYEGVPEKIFQYNPRMKFVFIMRHPLERAYSHYSHNIIIDKLPYTSFSDALIANDEILMSSMYMTQLDRFLEFFPESQMLLIDFDDFKVEPLGVINDIEDFLGVTKTLSSTKKTANKAGVKRSKVDVLNFIDSVRKLPYIKFLVDIFIAPRIRKKLKLKLNIYLSESVLVNKLALFKLKQVKPLESKDKEYFFKKILVDIERLEIFWKKDLSKWKS